MEDASAQRPEEANEIDADRGPRPGGMTFTGWLLAVGFPVLMLAIVLFQVVPLLIGSRGDSAAVKPQLIVFVVGVLGALFLLILTSGVGILLNARWGWGLAVAVFVSEILRMGITLWTGVSLLTDTQAPLAEYVGLFKYAARACISALFVLYLMGVKPRRFYRVTARDILAWISAGFALIGINHLAGWLVL